MQGLDDWRSMRAAATQDLEAEQMCLDALKTIKMRNAGLSLRQ